MMHKCKNCSLRFASSGGLERHGRLCGKPIPGAPKVINKRNRFRAANAVYVGRPTKWGNPYHMGKDGSRNAVIEKYRKYLMIEIAEKRLDVKELKGKNLVCWCAPLPCHADILLYLANRED